MNCLARAILLPKRRPPTVVRINMLQDDQRPMNQIDRSRVPKLEESDLDETFISGSGPGGQKVNKAVNCCQLKHVPTGIVVKVHQQRSLIKNREIARQLLVSKLDDLYNKENSVSSQKKRIALYRMALREEQNKKRTQMKLEFKKTQASEKTRKFVDINDIDRGLSQET